MKNIRKLDLDILTDSCGNNCTLFASWCLNVLLTISNIQFAYVTSLCKIEIYANVFTTIAR